MSSRALRRLREERLAAVAMAKAADGDDDDSMCLDHDDNNDDDDDDDNGNDNNDGSTTSYISRTFKWLLSFKSILASAVFCSMFCINIWVLRRSCYYFSIAPWMGQCAHDYH